MTCRVCSVLLVSSSSNKRDLSDRETRDCLSDWKVRICMSEEIIVPFNIHFLPVLLMRRAFQHSRGPNWRTDCSSSQNFGSSIFVQFYRSKRRLYTGYYTVARRYESYSRVVKTIFYERAQRVSKLCFHHEKIEFKSSSRRVIFFLLYRHARARHFQPFKAGKDVIDILTSEDMENMPLGSRM